MTKPVIIKIEETSFNEMDGFIIYLNDGTTIQLGIDNYQTCCENWGYFMTNDAPQDFIGASVLTINIVDTCLNVEKAPKLYEGNVMFVNIETNKGTLQFTAYNEHNGYYGHKAIVKSPLYTKEQCL